MFYSFPNSDMIALEFISCYNAVLKYCKKIMKTIFMLVTLLFFTQFLYAQERLLVVNKDGDSLSVLSIKSGKIIKTIVTGKSPHEVAVTPNQKTAIVTNYGNGCSQSQAGRSLTVVNLDDYSSKTIDLGKYLSPHGVVAFADNKRVALTVGCSQAVLVVDIVNGKVLKAIDTHAQVSHMLVLSQDEKLAFTANIGSGSVSVVDIVNGQHIKNIVTGDGAEGIDVSPDGKSIWVSNRAKHTLSVIDIATLEITQTIKVGNTPIRLKFHPTKPLAYVSNAVSASISVVDTQLMQVIDDIKMTEKSFKPTGNIFDSGPLPIGLVVSKDGKKAYVANTNVDEIRVIDLQTNTVISILTAGKRPDGLALID